MHVHRQLLTWTEEGWPLQCLSTGTLPCWQVKHTLAMVAVSLAARFQTNLARMRHLEACVPGWAMHCTMQCLKDLLPKRLGNYWPESPGTDVTEDGMAVYMLRAEVQSGIDT